jgi:hypothetical protein
MCGCGGSNYVLLRDIKRPRQRAIKRSRCICGYCPDCNPMSLEQSPKPRSFCPTCNCYQELGVPPGRIFNAYCPVHGKRARD